MAIAVCVGTWLGKVTVPAFPAILTLTCALALNAQGIAFVVAVSVRARIVLLAPVARVADTTHAHATTFTTARHSTAAAVQRVGAPIIFAARVSLIPVFTCALTYSLYASNQGLPTLDHRSPIAVIRIVADIFRFASFASVACHANTGTISEEAGNS